MAKKKTTTKGKKTTTKKKKSDKDTKKTENKIITATEEATEETNVDAKKQFPDSVFTIKFSNEEEFDVITYNPSNRFTAVRNVKGNRDFSLNKGGYTITDPNDPNNTQLGNSGTSADFTGLDDNPERIAKRLATKKTAAGNMLNAAHIIGILANIQAESSFKPDEVGDGGTSFGICQWHDDPSQGLDRGQKMKNAVGADWANNLDGQVDYLWKDLTTDYKASTLKPMITQIKEETEEAAISAMKIFCKNFEHPANMESEYKTRTGYVKTLWSKIKIIAWSLSGDGDPDIEKMGGKWVAKGINEMPTDTDGASKSYKSGSHQPQTSVRYSNNNSVEADLVPYIVSPYTSDYGKVCLVKDTKKKKYTFGIVADGNPNNPYREVSLKTSWNIGHSYASGNASATGGDFYIGIFDDKKLLKSGWKLKYANHTELEAGIKQALNLNGASSSNHGGGHYTK